MANVDVLGASMGNRVTDQGDATLIVGVDDGCVNLWVSEVLK